MAFRFIDNKSLLLGDLETSKFLTVTIFFDLDQIQHIVFFLICSMSWQWPPFILLVCDASQKSSCVCTAPHNVKPGLHLNMRQAKACQICLCMLVYMTHYAVANSLSWLHALHSPIHWLLVHQSEAKPCMLRCIHSVDITLKEEQTLFFFK